MRRPFRLALFALAGAAGSIQAASPPAYLVRDIRPGDLTSMVSVPPRHAVHGDRLLLYANDGVAGLEPWGSDGTTAGTQRLANIRGSGDGVSLPAGPHGLGALVLFPGDDGFLGREWWVSDGSPAGTSLLVDSVPGSSSGTSLRPVRFGGAIYWLESGDLWRSDGTPAGTQKIRDASGASDGLFVLDGRLRWLAGTTFMTSDGTAAGTVAGDTVPAGLNVSLSSPVVLRKFVYFHATNVANGAELWRSDWTAAGTTLVADIVPGAGSSAPAPMRQDDGLLLLASTPVQGRELWRSDGTAAGTTLVADLRPGNDSGGAQEFVFMDGIAYFTADDGVAGVELWRSDGTPAGTQRVLDLTPPGGDSATVRRLTRVAKSLLGTFTDGVLGREPWISDGTASGTRIWEDISPGFTPSNVSMYAGAGGRVFMDATTPTVNHELFAKALHGPEDTALTWCERTQTGLPHVGAEGFDMPLPAFEGTLTDLDVALDLSSNYVEDLRVELQHLPSQTSVVLVDRLRNTAGNGCAADELEVRLDDSATSPLEGQCAPGSTSLAYPRRSSWRPENPLAAFAGRSLAGPWRLIVTDLAAQDGAALHEWCLHFTRAATVDAMFANGFE